MPAEHHVLTIPAQVPNDLRMHMLCAVEQALDDAGASRIWVDTSVVRDVAVMAELPDA
jgi:hypothetical protein